MTPLKKKIVNFSLGTTTTFHQQNLKFIFMACPIFITIEKVKHKLQKLKTLPVEESLLPCDIGNHVTLKFVDALFVE